MRISAHRTLRTIGWAAAYALALHTILVSFALPAISAGSGAAFAALCLSTGSADDSGTSAPHGSDVHCPSCTAAPSALPPPAPPVTDVVRLAHRHTAQAFTAQRQHTEAIHRPGQPRAPPVLA
jgi:hypothetical protein